MSLDRNAWLDICESWIDSYAIWMKGWLRVFFNSTKGKPMNVMNVWHNAMQDFIR